MKDFDESSFCCISWSVFDMITGLDLAVITCWWIWSTGSVLWHLALFARDGDQQLMQWPSTWPWFQICCWALLYVKGLKFGETPIGTHLFFVPIQAQYNGESERNVGAPSWAPLHLHFASSSPSSFAPFVSIDISSNIFWRGATNCTTQRLHRPVSCHFHFFF